MTRFGMWLLAAGLSGAAPAAGWAAPCAAGGADAGAVAAAWEAVEAACPCDGFARHPEYTRCVKAVTALRAAGDLLSRACASALRRRAKRSTCSFATPRVACCEERAGGTKRSCRIRSPRRCSSSARAVRTPCATAAFCADTRCGPAPACGPEILYSAEGNRLRRFDVGSILTPPLVEDVLIERAASDPQGRDINGQICAFPDGSGRFVAGEDTGQPHPPAGWGVFAANGTQIGKLTATYFTDGAEPFGCAFDGEGRLFTSEVGNQASGDPNGQLLLWFPPYDRFPGPPSAYPATDEASIHFCKLAVDIGTAGSVATDAQGRVYVASARGGAVLRFSPPFPTGADAAGGCGGVDATGAPLASGVRREVFAPVLTASGIAAAPNGHWFFASVLTGTIGEFDTTGALVRSVLAPPPGQTTLPLPTGHPQGIAVDCLGNLYYADLALRVSGGGIGPGPNGTVRRIGFDVCGVPEPPVVVRDGLAFPDGLGVLPGDLAP